MSALSLRLPLSLHNAARRLARKDGISMNQLIATALAEKMSALMTEDYLEERAKRASRTKFEKAMSKARNIEPGLDADRL